MGIMSMDASIRGEDITPRHRGSHTYTPINERPVFSIMYSALNLSFDLIFFFYIYIYSQASNPSCEACQEAAAIRRTAEIVFLTVTGSVRQNCFPERSTRADGDRGAHFRRQPLHAQVLRAMKSSPGCPKCTYWSPTNFSFTMFNSL